MHSARAQERYLIAVPYAALLAMALLLIALPVQMASGADAVWLGVRWLMRAGVLAGTVWALRVHRSDPRPLWIYAWLGFAAYEVVAATLTAATSLVDTSGPGSVFAHARVVTALYLFVFSFAPVVIVAAWVALRSRQIAAYTVFPYAAATFPLFFLAGIFPLFSDTVSFVFVSILSLVATAVIAVFFEEIPNRWRWHSLFAAVVVCQALLFVNPTQWNEFPLFLFPFLAVFGLFILTIPLILHPIYLSVFRILDSYRLANWIPHTWNPKLVSSSTFSSCTPSLAQQSVSHDDLRGGVSMSEKTEPMAESSQPKYPKQPAPRRTGPSRLDRVYKSAVIVLTALIVLAVGLVIARATVHKVHEYERGLHLRGGRFVGVQKPGWHMQIPMVDTVIIVKTNERLGYVEQIPAMTSDNVTMVVSLQYTYKVDDPEQYALQVDDPERIVFEFVQGKLRDVVNTKAMDDVMNNRALMNQEVMEALKAKEEQYGVQFVTVQMQNASPPEEVVQAIRDRMVALQRQEQAQAEAAQRQTQADADLYAAQKQADAQAYQITTTAAAEADSIRLTSAAEKDAVNALLAELEGTGEIGQRFIDYLIAQELKENSKWVIGGEGAPIVDLR